MSLPRRTAVRRLLIGLLLVAALAGGLWWNASRLNETEQELVGVWEIVDQTAPQAFVFLPDHNQYVAALDLAGGPWKCTPEVMGSWDAISDSLVLRSPFRFPRTTSLKVWQLVASDLWNGGNRRNYRIVRVSAVEIELQEETPNLGKNSWTLRRSKNPELVDIFNRLKAGESP